MLITVVSEANRHANDRDDHKPDTDPLAILCEVSLLKITTDAAC